jgi:thymidylate synthase
MMKFEPLVENKDLDIHPDPPDPNTAVCCMWNDAEKVRKDYPDVSVIGPLRSVRGIDLLVRSLLANPQIEVVHFVGPDLTEGEQIRETLISKCWSRLGLEGMRPLVRKDMPDEALLRLLGRYAMCGNDEVLELRPTGEPNPKPELYPPPPPVAEVKAPHGDPGSCLRAETLSGVWPQVLREILTCGRKVGTHYGDTLEIHNLVSVIRDPKKTVNEVISGCWLPFTFEEMEGYARRVTTDFTPPGAHYSYGTRMAEQFPVLERLLAEDPENRAIFLSPWKGEGAKDLSGGKGRPCLVGVQFRVICGALHGTFVFRSHDYFAGYPLNLAALCMWIWRLAEMHSFKIGVLTCLSVSAHLYDRDWDAAKEVVDKRLLNTTAGIQWDRRSAWHITKEGGVITAVALSAVTKETIGVFEGRTPEILQREILKSGLVTSIGNAMWLGREIEKAGS